MSAPQVLYLQQIALCQIAGAAALFYDYLLAFGNEVDLIWARKWNIVTVLYAIVRYLSFLLVMDTFLYMGDMSWTPDFSINSESDGLWGLLGFVWYQIRMWGPYVFRVAMDIIMMKRVYALSCSPGRFLNSSRWVVVVMVIAFIVRYAACVSFLMLAIGPGSGITSIEAKISGVRVCGTRIPKSEFVIFPQFPTLGFEVLLFVLAFGYFIADVLESRRSKPPKAWKVNDIVQILVRDSTIYFAINVAATAMEVANFKVPAPSVYIAVSLALQSFLIYCFAPRLVLNLKEHENRVHMSGFGEELSNMQFMEGPLQ